jgi:hypothetical protein
MSPRRSFTVSNKLLSLAGSSIDGTEGLSAGSDDDDGGSNPHI